jgi:hypothetical protein
MKQLYSDVMKGKTLLLNIYRIKYSFAIRDRKRERLRKRLKDPLTQG